MLIFAQNHQMLRIWRSPAWTKPLDQCWEEKRSFCSVIKFKRLLWFLHLKKHWQSFQSFQIKWCMFSFISRWYWHSFLWGGRWWKMGGIWRLLPYWCPQTGLLWIDMHKMVDYSRFCHQRQFSLLQHMFNNTVFIPISMRSCLRPHHTAAQISHVLPQSSCSSGGRREATAANPSSSRIFLTIKVVIYYDTVYQSSDKLNIGP